MKTKLRDEIVRLMTDSTKAFRKNLRPSYFDTFFNNFTGLDNNFWIHSGYSQSNSLVSFSFYYYYYFSLHGN